MTYEKRVVGAEHLDDTLNQAKLLGPFPRSGLPVGGKTLIFGGQPITFPGEDGATVRLNEIAATLRAGVPGSRVNIRPSGFASSIENLQAYLSIAGDSGFTIGAGGTANEAFGLSTERDTVGRAPIPAENIRGVARTMAGEYDVYLGGEDGPWNKNDEDDE